jgi:hypothetical protein
MAKIYRRAERVHIFLTAFDRNARNTSLLECKWFERRWVIQEAVVAQKVSIHFKDITNKYPWQQLHSWDELIQHTRESAIHLHAASSTLPGAALPRDLADSIKPGIFSLLLKFHHAQCGDDRDRIFALLGISNDTDTKMQTQNIPSHLVPFQKAMIRYKPNYTQDTNTVYRNFALAALRSLLGYDALHCAGALRCVDSASITSNKTLPSWVPDWRNPLRYKPLLRVSACHAGKIKPSNKHNFPKGAAIPVHEPSGRLTISGIPLSTVQCLLSTSPEPDTFVQTPRFVKADWLGGEDAQIDLAADRICVVCSDGRMEVVPVGVGVGDEVVLLLRAQTPFVLRRRRREGGGGDTVEYEVVGDCYVFDEEVMSGGVLNGLDGASVVQFGIV